MAGRLQVVGLGALVCGRDMKQRPEELDVKMRNEIRKGPEEQKGLEHAWEQE